MEGREVYGGSEDTNTGNEVTAILRTQQTRRFSRQFGERFFFSLGVGSSLHLTERHDVFPGVFDVAVGSLKVTSYIGFPQRVRAIEGFVCGFGIPFTELVSESLSANNEKTMKRKDLQTR